MKKDATPIWGLLLIGIGVVFALRSLGIFHGLNFWFWISLVVIIPCFIRLFTGRENKTGYLMGIAFGIFLMLNSLHVISFGMLIPLFIAAVFVVAGINLLIKRDQKQKDDIHYTSQQEADTTFDGNETYWQQQSAENRGTQADYIVEHGNSKNTQSTGFVFGSSQTGGQENASFTGSYQEQSSYNSSDRGDGYTAYTAVLSGRDINFNNEVFHGVMLSAVLGGIDLDLRHAIFTKNVTIDVKAILGGVDIIVPRNVKVVVNCTPILGSMEDKTISPNPNSSGTVNCPTIYVNATCVLGGVEIKY